MKRHNDFTISKTKDAFLLKLNIVGLSNICYTDRGKIPQYLIRSLPAKGTHGKVVVIPAVIAFQLGVKSANE